MFDRAASHLIATAAACAAAVLAVMAAGFAMFAALRPAIGEAWGAAAVAAAATLAVGGFALYAHLRAQAREREAELARAQLLNGLPANLAELTREHPLATLALTLAGGVLAARHPRVSRDLIAIVARLLQR